MKDFHQNYLYRSSDADKKGRKIKNHQRETCKCFVPFVKLHYHDCPLVRKSCPVHRSGRHCLKEEKGEQTMIISFHPSSKTERLFQPVKKLLTQCSPDTKVNLQYYSPKSSTSKESTARDQVLPKSEDERKSLNNNAFVEKTKSFVSEKTNKMKKLKQCFHSPCNSIAQKSRSQTSVKEKLHDIFWEEGKRCDLGDFVPDKPPDEVKNDPNWTWLSNKLDFKDWEKVSVGKIDSDFFTVTQKAKKNVINHQIFEIKHKKGLSDLSFINMPKKNNQFVYSAFDVNHPVHCVKDTCECPNLQGKKYSVNKNYSMPEEGVDNKQKGDEELSSSNSQMSSTSSVYFTPFIFVPADSNAFWSSEANDKEGIPSPLLESEKDVSIGEPKTKSVQLQTDQSGDSANEWYHRYTEMAESFTTRGTQTDEVFFSSNDNIYDESDMSFAMASKNYSDEQTSTPSNPSSYDTSKRKANIPEQTSSYVIEESFINTTHYAKSTSTTNKMSQTESVKTQEVYKRQSSKNNKSKGTIPYLTNKSTQTSFSVSESGEEMPEYIDLNSSNVTYVIKPFENQVSDQAIDKLSKAWWGKSHSDSELYENKKCGCLKPEIIIPLPHSCVCQPSGGTRDAMVPEEAKTKPKTPDSTKVKTQSNADKAQGTTSGVTVRPETPKADKSLGTDSGGHRIYKRADKSLGTDDYVSLGPEMPKKTGKILPAPNSSKGVTVTSSKPEKSPTAECMCKAEQTTVKDEDTRTPLSDLSELTRIIQEFFQKTGMTSFRNCSCETQTVSDKKIETNPNDPIKSSDEQADKSTEVQTGSKKKVVISHSTDDSKNPEDKIQPPPTDTKEPVTQKSENSVTSERVKIRRSVLLDDSPTKTRFVCSVCAREISIFSISVATNTESVLTSRKKDNTTEVTEVVKVKTVKTVNVEPSKGANQSNASEGTSSGGNKPLRELVENTLGTGNNEWKRQPAVTRPTTTRPTTTRPTTTRPTTTRTTTTVTPSINVIQPAATKKCICEIKDNFCNIHTCPRLDPTISTATTSRAPQNVDAGTVQKSENSGGVAGQTGSTRRSGDRPRTQRRTPGNYYPVYIKSTWPRELTLNVSDTSQNVLYDSKSATSQYKRSYEKETGSADIPGGKKIKAEMEKASRQCFMFGEPASSDFRRDSKLFPSKGKFYWIPSLSTSHVSPPKQNNLTQSKVIKSEEKVGTTNHPMSSEGIDNSPDLFPTKSCHPTPYTFGYHDKPFDTLFGCRCCKSLTFIKPNKDDVWLSLPQGVIAFRPETPEDRSSAEPYDEDQSGSLPHDCTSSQNFDKLLEKCAKFSMVSGSPSTEEFPEEEIGQATEEELERKCQNPHCYSLLEDMFETDIGTSSKSFNSVWLNEYAKKN